MSTGDWLLFAIAGALGLAGLVGIRRLWRRETTFYDRVPGWWIWSDALWRGFVRALPVGAVGFLMFIATGITAALVPEVPPSETCCGFARPVWAVALILVPFCLIMLLLATIVLFNWPAALVPPHLRGQPGLIREWLGDRRKKTPSPQDPAVRGGRAVPRPPGADRG